MPLFGVDVSVNNGEINYTAMKYAGIHFAMVKATQGHSLYTEGLQNFRDSRFVRNIEGFYKVGIPVGAYHFFTATTVAEANAEAELFLSAVKPYKDKISLYLACDVENYNNPWIRGLSKETLTGLVDVFCRKVAKAGYPVCHYTNTDHLRNYIDMDKLDFPIWHAHYMSGTSVSRPKESGNKLAIHQYTNTGRIAGTAGNFDLNFGYGPLARLIIHDRTPLLPITLDYIAKFKSGENILTRIAAKLVNPSLNPVKNPAYEKLVPLIRYHCELTNEETAYLTEYKFALELFTKLYNAMVR